jgi:hypothetical protein
LDTAAASSQGKNDVPHEMEINSEEINHSPTHKSAFNASGPSSPSYHPPSFDSSYDQSHRNVKKMSKTGLQNFIDRLTNESKEKILRRKQAA